jgi:hypothetical protein
MRSTQRLAAARSTCNDAKYSIGNRLIVPMHKDVPTTDALKEDAIRTAVQEVDVVEGHEAVALEDDVRQENVQEGRAAADQREGKLSICLTRIGADHLLLAGRGSW